MGMDTEFELEWHKSKDKELTLFFIDKFSRAAVVGSFYYN